METEKIMFDKNGKPDVSSEKIDYRKGIANETEGKIVHLKVAVAEIGKVCDKNKLLDKNEPLSEVLVEKINSVKTRASERGGKLFNSKIDFFRITIFSGKDGHKSSNFEPHWAPANTRLLASVAHARLA